MQPPVDNNGKVSPEFCGFWSMLLWNDKPCSNPNAIIVLNHVDSMTVKHCCDKWNARMIPSWRLDASGAYVPLEYILAFDAVCMLYVLAHIQQFLLHTGPSHCVIRNVNIIDINNAFHTDICLQYFHHNHQRSDLELCAFS